jgi:O-succinylbenzoate synthase
MLPSLPDVLASARVVDLPLVTRFRGITSREAVLLEGPAGWSEFSPFVEYDDAESVAWLAAALEFGWQEAPALQRDTVPVNATVPAIDAADVPALLARFPGCRTAKVKVADPGQTLAEDVARVRAVRQVLGAEGRIRIDANGLWNVDEAEHAIHAMVEFDLEYVEQPCATIDEMAEIRRRTDYLDLPIAADESVRKESDPLLVSRSGAADLLVVKVQPLGGIRAVLAMQAETGLPLIVSSALDTSVGISMGAFLAGALPELDYDCGLATASLLAADVTHDPMLPVGGSIPVRRVVPDANLLDTYAASPERRDWWLARITRTHALLTD